MLASLIPRLLHTGYHICFSGLTGSIRDVFKRTGLFNKIGAEHFFSSATVAVENVYSKAHENSSETDCPLLDPLRDEKSNQE